ncbi:hypothetical protein [Coraliomargarita parva]|uniref:hypothetical protein n=1 Tax=Coraliomargarita parva TaxID=3014050 RepID=UPI0022B3975E|nr:hypothetical protein [Coraliomargarita parva]
MKLPICLISLLVACLIPLSAEEAAAERVLPTEVSDPPYEVGQAPWIAGYYIERDDATSLNFRFEENQIRLYWIDEYGTIAEPEATEANVRFMGSVRGRPYHSLTTLGGGAGLGAPAIMVPPHIYNIILNVKNPETGEFDTYSFRYNISMDEAKEPEFPLGTE